MKRTEKNRHIAHAYISLICIIGIIGSLTIGSESIYLSNSSETLETTVNILQQQINAARPGTTLYLAAQTYTDPITINKPLTLVGIPKQTILSVTSVYNSYALHISAAYVTIQNLTVTNDGPGLYTTGIKITGDYTTIQDCIVRDTPVGIAIWSSNNQITGCAFYRCEDEGIALLGSSYQYTSGNTITDCRFYENCDGIELQNSENTRITGCAFYDHTHAGIDAIGAYNSGLLIDQCSFEDSTVFDIYLANTINSTISETQFSTEKLELYASPDIQVIHPLDEPSDIEKNQVSSPLRERIEYRVQQFRLRLEAFLTKLHALQQHYRQKLN